MKNVKGVEIRPSYATGQKLWYVEPEELKYDCPVCKGEGITEANVAKKIYTVKCPECMGWRHLYRTVFTVKAVKVKALSIQVFSKTLWVATYKLSNDKNLYEELKNNKRRFYAEKINYSVFLKRNDACDYAKKENKELEVLEEHQRKNNAKRDLAEQEVMYDIKL